MGRAAAALLVGFALFAPTGCGSSGTRVLLELSLAAGAPPPDTLTVRVYGPKGSLVAPTSFDHPELPGRLILTGFDDSTAATLVRIALNGKGARATRGSGLVLTKRNQQVATAIVIGESLADGDADGVPDPIDDCPTVADPEQVNSDGLNPGDACGGGSGPDMSASVDATGNPSLCASAGVRFCDGFESGNIDGAKWSNRVEPMASLTVDGTRAYRGSYSLHARLGTTTFQGYSGAEVREGSSFRQDPIHVRAFMFLLANLPNVGFQFMRLEQDQDPFGGLGLELQPNLSLVNYDFNLPQKHFTMDSAAKFPLDRWVCVEWRVGPLMSMPDGGMFGTTQLWLDGTELVDQRLSGLNVVPPIDYVTFGMDSGGGNGGGAMDAWFDEIAVDDKPIGCAK